MLTMIAFTAPLWAFTMATRGPRYAFGVLAAAMLVLALVVIASRALRKRWRAGRLASARYVDSSLPGVGNSRSRRLAFWCGRVASCCLTRSICCAILHIVNA